MKKSILIILFLSAHYSTSNAQIKTVTEPIKQVSETVIPYDSIRNYLEKNELEQYVGQTFYLPKTTYEEEKGFPHFKKDIKGTAYKAINKTSSAKTKYEAVSGKYFKVIGVERKTRAYVGDIYIHLMDIETKAELYYDFGKCKFPFIVQGYYEKMHNELIGRTFYFDFGKTKKCIDYYIKEGVDFSEMVKFEDGTTRIFGNLLLAEDAAGRNVSKQIENDKKNKAKYGELRLGIDENACEKICGSPIKKNISEGEWGKHEQWVYDDKYIYLENGKVTSIQYEKE